MNNQNYRDMVDDVIEQQPGAYNRIGNRQVKQLPAIAGHIAITLQFPNGDHRQGMQILYRRRDAYIMGYRTAGNQFYAAHNQVANIPNSLSLRFNDDYATLGWNRQGLAINRGGPTVDVPSLDIALHSAAVGPTSAGQLCTIVVALAEGIRFMDVEKAVRGQLRISTDMVDWNQQLAAGEACLRQGQKRYRWCSDQSFYITMFSLAHIRTPRTRLQ